MSRSRWLILLSFLSLIYSVLLLPCDLEGSETLVGRQKIDDSSVSLIKQEIRYYAPEAGEVWLIWGINGWQHAPDSMRPPASNPRTIETFGNSIHKR